MRGVRQHSLSDGRTWTIQYRYESIHSAVETTDTNTIRYIPRHRISWLYQWYTVVPFHCIALSDLKCFKAKTGRGVAALRNEFTSRPLCIAHLTATGKRNGAVLLKCSDGTGLWISHMKCVSKPNITSTVDTFQVPPIKLPSTLVLPKDVVESLPCIPEPSLYVPFGERPSTFQEVLKHSRPLVWARVILGACRFPVGLGFLAEGAWAMVGVRHVCNVYVHLEELRSFTKVLVWGKRDGIPDEDIHKRQCVPKNQTSKKKTEILTNFAC